MSDQAIPVILSGGAGKRLWPVSRRALPKPFMRLPDGESLLEKVLRRALAVATPGTPIVTVTGRDHYFLTRDEYAGIAPESAGRHRYLLEPVGRNTAPAVIAAALHVVDAVDRDAVLIVLPADHLVNDRVAFAAAVRDAIALAREDYLVTFGVVPTRAETGFGYIRRGAPLGATGFEVERFVEKPDLATARAYLESGQYLWNSGMFAFRAGVLLDAAASACPGILAATRAAYAGARRTGALVQFDPAAFAAIGDISLDFALMERAPRRAVVPAHFDWDDVGSWVAVAQQARPDARGNRVVGDALLVDSDDCYVQAGERTVAAIGVSDLTIVETRDAVLVAHRDSAQDVRRVVDALQARGAASVEQHATVRRPWGSYTVLEDAADCKVKRLVVKPGQILSLQLHHRRSEHWTVVRGIAKVRIGEREFLLHSNESVFIPMQTIHRLENPTSEDIALIEVQCGDYFGEDDIVRLEDVYGRAGTKTP